MMLRLFGCLLERCCQLVRTGRGLVAAADAAQAGDDLVDGHTFNEPADALQVAALQPPMLFRSFKLAVLDVK